MTHDTWTTQKARLIDRFGQNNFSKEFSLLCSIECQTMPDAPFVEMVNAMIGNRKPSNPPLLQDFRDARLAYEKRKFEADVTGAQRGMNTAWAGGLQAYLRREFPGCKTLNEAVEVRKHQIAIAKAEDANYDPMTDVKWMGK